MAEGEKKAEASKDKGGKDEEAGTWKRSKLVPNTSRLMIGDREHSPGDADDVRIDGFGRG
jgi:hypothetical protein